MVCSQLPLLKPCPFPSWGCGCTFCAFLPLSRCCDQMPDKTLHKGRIYSASWFEDMIGKAWCWKANLRWQSRSRDETGPRCKSSAPTSSVIYPVSPLPPSKGPITSTNSSTSWGTHEPVGDISLWSYMSLPEIFRGHWSVSSTPSFCAC